jgi:V/A-type H+/Na+-transporting ATPase subunit C
MRKTTQQKTFPYAYARVSAMKAKLISKNEYHKLLKVDLPSITRFLGESEYKSEITKLSAKYDGIELVDRALKKNEEKTYNKLRRICPNEIVDVINLYLSKADFQNLKIVLRGIYSNATKEDVMSIIEPVGKFNQAHFEKLFDMGSILKILSKSKIVTPKMIQETYDDYKEEKNLIKLENSLDKIFYQKAIDGCKQIDDHGATFKEFLLREIDIVNIINLLRFKKEKIDQKNVYEHMVVHGLRINKMDLKRLSGKDSIEALYNELKKTYYGKHVKFEGNITDVELQLKKYHMKNSALKNYKNPLSFVNILSYMMRKVVEVKNIRSLVKSKHLGIDADYVEKKLLVI